MGNRESFDLDIHSKKSLKGSPTRDEFKYLHKQNLPKEYWACDTDLTLVDIYPPGAVAVFDYKKSGEPITFSEVLWYNELIERWPVYIIEGDNVEQGPFKVSRYKGGNWRTTPLTVELEVVALCEDWDALGHFEQGLRNNYRRRGRHARDKTPNH